MYLLVVCCLALVLYHNSLNLPTLCTVLIFCVCVRVCVKQICFDLVVRTTLVTSFFDPLLFTHISVCVCVFIMYTHTHTHTHTLLFLNAYCIAYHCYTIQASLISKVVKLVYKGTYYSCSCTTTLQSGTTYLTWFR